MNLGETVTYCSLKRVFLCGRSLPLCRLRVLICPFVGELVWCECKWHLFSGYAGICHLGREGATHRGAKPGAGCEVRLPPAQWTSLPSWLWGLIPPCGAKAFMVRPELVLFSLSLCFPLSPGWDPCLREGGVLKLEGARVTSWLISSADRDLSCLLTTPGSAP